MDRDRMNRHNIIKEFFKGCAPIAMGFLLGGIACFLITLAGCKAQHTVERIEVPVVTTQEHTIESVRIDHVRDTLLQRDSIYHFVQGDTVRIEKWHYIQNTAQVLRVDTVFKTDSVQVPVTTEIATTQIKEVPHPLSWWQKTLMGAGGLAMISLLLLIAYKFRKR